MARRGRPAAPTPSLLPDGGAPLATTRVLTLASSRRGDADDARSAAPAIAMLSGGNPNTSHAHRHPLVSNETLHPVPAEVPATLR